MTLLATDPVPPGQCAELLWNPEGTLKLRLRFCQAKPLTEVGRTLQARESFLSHFLKMAILSVFSAGSRRTTSVLMDGPVPESSCPLPHRKLRFMLLSVHPIWRRRRVVFPSWQKRTLPLRLQFTEDGQVSIDAGRGDEARASESMPAQLDGHEITVAYNPRTFRRDWVPSIPTFCTLLFLH